MPSGQIIKAISGFFYVRTPEGTVQCRSRGIFKHKKNKMTPLVGDFVQFEKTDQGNGIITGIGSRQNELLRPPISNVDQGIIVSSLCFPSFQSLVVDRFLAYGEYRRLKLIVCITKRDLVENENELSQITEIYRSIGYPVIATSIYTQAGLIELRQHLSLKTTVFAGESGVGKSSLLQELLPEQEIKTGMVSERLGRGKHTTRAVELLSLPCGGQVADTPGFSKLSLKGILPTDLGACFPEIRTYAQGCYYRDCYHVKEPRCEVQKAVGKGLIHNIRYQNYLTFLRELQEEGVEYKR